MKKMLSLLLMLALLASPACALSFTDACGRNVSVESPVRVVSLYSSYGDAWLNAGGSLAGSIADAFGSVALEQGVQNLGSHINPNMELLFSLDPDFVLLSADVSSHREIALQLEQANIPCAFFSTQDYKTYLEMISVFAQLTGRDDLYMDQVQKVLLPIEKIIAEAESLPSSPTALLIRANSSTIKCKNSKDTVAGNILRDMGFINLADSSSALCESIGLEAVLIEDPDYIFVVLQGSNQSAAENTLTSVLTGNPAWNTLSAVREGRFYMLNRELFHYHPNEKWAQAYEIILNIRKGEQ